MTAAYTRELLRGVDSRQELHLHTRHDCGLHTGAPPGRRRPPGAPFAHAPWQRLTHGNPRGVASRREIIRTRAMPAAYTRELPQGVASRPSRSSDLHTPILDANNGKRELLPRTLCVPRLPKGSHRDPGQRFPPRYRQRV